ncbi:MAG: class I tRNA ligase family protein, partial [Geminicoccaceae bacterium]|nr:class I tRNA ligase family protein [Geminicoccaceae bacterium]
DIIFFWAARMMMLGLRFMGEVPFHEVFIHGLVRDERGQKMSKSRGNVIDPLELIEKYGADALRFTILASTAQGRDIKLGEGRVQGYRNFTTKLWNAARFCELNGCEWDAGFDPRTAREPVNRWVLSKLEAAVGTVTQALEEYRFNEAAAAAYRFTWDEFCDWYLELAKPVLQGADGGAKEETRKTAAFALHRLLHLLHPMTPFVTEELWQQRFARANHALIVGRWPNAEPDLADPASEDELDWLIRAITAIRAARNELGVPPAARLPLLVQGAAETTLRRIERHGEAMQRLARLERVETGAPATLPGGNLQVVVDEATFALPLAGVVDLDAERHRLGREIQKAEGEISRFDQKLANPKFIDRAPPDVVEEQRARRAEAVAMRERLAAALTRIAG